MLNHPNSLWPSTLFVVMYVAIHIDEIYSSKSQTTSTRGNENRTCLISACLIPCSGNMPLSLQLVSLYPIGSTKPNMLVYKRLKEMAIWPNLSSDLEAVMSSWFRNKFKKKYSKIKNPIAKTVVCLKNILSTLFCYFVILYFGSSLTARDPWSALPNPTASAVWIGSYFLYSFLSDAQCQSLCTEWRGWIPVRTADAVRFGKWIQGSRGVIVQPNKG